MGSLDAHAATPFRSTDVSHQRVAGASHASVPKYLRPCIRELDPEQETELRRFLPMRHSQLALTRAAWVAGAFVEKELCGVVELYEQNCPQDVEVTLVVAEAWRQCGLGSALLRGALQWAQRTGRAQLRMLFSRDNWPMRKLASKLDAKLDLVLDEIVAEVAIARAPIEDIDRFDAQELP